KGGCTMTQLSHTPAATRRWWHAVGPAIIVASVVLGPGSIYLSSKIGTQFGYSLLWILAGGSVLMMGMMALGARLGVVLSDTPCNEIAHRFGRGAAVLVGVTVFLIVALFQASN